MMVEAAELGDVDMGRMVTVSLKDNTTVRGPLRQLRCNPFGMVDVTVGSVPFILDRGDLVTVERPFGGPHPVEATQLQAIENLHRFVEGLVGHD